PYGDQSAAVRPRYLGSPGLRREPHALPAVRGQPRGRAPARARSPGVPGGGGNGTGDAAADHHPQRMPAQRLAPPGEEMTARPAMVMSMSRLASTAGDVATSTRQTAT